MHRLFQWRKDQVLNSLIRDYVSEIPEGIKDPGVRVLEDNGRKIKTLLRFMAFEIHARMAQDSRRSDFYRGMLTQLLLIDNMIHKVREADQKPSAAIPTESALKKSLDGVRTFTEKLSTLSPLKDE